MDQNLPRIDEPPVIVIRLEGELVNHEDTELELLISELISKKCRNFIIDFNKVQFIDSAGIGLIIKLASIIENKFGTLMLCNPQKNVRNVFNMLGIEERFKIYNNLTEALLVIGRLMRLEIISVMY
ncbi:MAG TPA: STAS domain-containing protein [bacterium]|nr:STAS domain-containing protein [bacterium]